MTSLSDPVLLGKTDPSQDTIRKWTIHGGHEVIQEKLGEAGWDGRNQVASIGLFQDNQGKIVDSQIFLSGFRTVGHISAKMIWGDKLQNDDYVKMNTMDTSQANIRGRMVSDWISSDKEDWVLKIINPETKRFRVVDKLAEDSLKEKGASKMAFRYHIALNKGPSLNTKLGVAPTGDIDHTVGQGSMNFPMIGLGSEAKVEILPGEPAGQGWGLGFTPFIINMGDADAPTPSIEDIRGAIEDMFNNACKPQMKKTYKTWKDSMAKGGWEPVDPTYLWPSRTGQATEDSEEGMSYTRNKQPYGCDIALWL
jgi:hypothetical protein